MGRRRTWQPGYLCASHHQLCLHARSSIFTYYSASRFARATYPITRFFVDTSPWCLTLSIEVSSCSITCPRYLLVDLAQLRGGAMCIWQQMHFHAPAFLPSNFLSPFARQQVCSIGRHCNQICHGTTVSGSWLRSPCACV
ncbi:hypothetical protein CY34DRAFT_181582 [Suillus luteus UH-Slu-Lm8-n1]|uniref:Uncharacterized protein n=1 Tax=Suillus luteus UH-Slu-Lm8-n1 TaxID=930992 RepID=A0A0D0BF16_9AGAM|nr:hypothetical protein CY34DRAFT_181582 [Suillus luteus UH-Slu-Lm8-n1]